MMEATYFLQKLIEYYHSLDEFCFNLNATIQSIRNITFTMQSELAGNSTFDEWYPTKQTEMKNHSLLRRFVDARNIVVTKGSLKTKSMAKVGLFKNGRLNNSVLIAHARQCFYRLMIDAEHSAVGEELGVQREWVAEEIGNEEVVSLCNTVIDYFGLMLCDLADLLGSAFKWVPGDIRALHRAKIFLESDTDPSLPAKWGWH
jgi:hypothetical protein